MFTDETARAAVSGEFALVARQPICDQRVRLVAYELLYRGSDLDRAQFADGDVATAKVSVNALLEIGLDALVGRSQAYVNVTRTVLLQNLYDFLPAERVVLELLDDIHPDREVLAGVARAKSRGYTIAIDDYAGEANRSPLLELADIVKVDLPRLGEGEIERLGARLARRGRRLLAEKVETHEVFERCKRAGFVLFQGYFFARPQIVRGARLPADRATLVRVLARVQDENADIEEIEQLVAANVTLSYKLLRYVNSALHGVPKRIESIRHAVVMLGLDRVRTCVMMLVLAGMDDKPHELMITALVRARYCQLLATARNHASTHKFFTVGLLSVVDAFMDRPMDELVAELRVTPELEAALLRHEGELGLVLEAAIAWERADWDKLLNSGFDRDALRTAYLQAIGWAAETDAVVAGGGK